MRNFPVLLKKDLLALIRSKKFLVMLIMMVLFAMESPLMAYLTPKLLKSMGEEYAAITSLIPNPTNMDAFVQLSKNITQIVLLVTIAMFSSILVRERVKGTYATLKMNGVRLKEFLLSHICSQIIVFTVSYVVALIFFIFYTIILFDKMPSQSGFALFCLYLFMIQFIVILNVVSHFSKSTTISMVASFGLYFLFVLLAMFEKINLYLPMKLTENAVNVLGNEVGTKEWKTVVANSILLLLILFVGVLFKKDRVNNRIK